MVRLGEAVGAQQLAAQAAAHVHPDFLPGLARVGVVAVVQPHRHQVHVPGLRGKRASSHLHVAPARDDVLDAENRRTVAVDVVARIGVCHPRQLHEKRFRLGKPIRQKADKLLFHA